jgi:hypothetical protein
MDALSVSMPEKFTSMYLPESLLNELKSMRMVKREPPYSVVKRLVDDSKNIQKKPSVKDRLLNVQK